MSFELDKHVSMFARFFTAFPQEYESLDPNRMTLLHFTVASMTLLGQSIPNVQDVVDWVYAQQVHPDSLGNGNILVKKLNLNFSSVEMWICMWSE